MSIGSLITAFLTKPMMVKQQRLTIKMKCYHTDGQFLAEFSVFFYLWVSVSMAECRFGSLDCVCLLYIVTNDLSQSDATAHYHTVPDCIHRAVVDGCQWRYAANSSTDVSCWNILRVVTFTCGSLCLWRNVVLGRL